MFRRFVEAMCKECAGTVWGYVPEALLYTVAMVAMVLAEMHGCIPKCLAPLTLLLKVALLSALFFIIVCAMSVMRTEERGVGCVGSDS